MTKDEAKRITKRFLKLVTSDEVDITTVEHEGEHVVIIQRPGSNERFTSHAEARTFLSGIRYVLSHIEVVL